MSDQKFQLHNSGMDLLTKCGIAFEKGTILREHRTVGVQAAIGSAVDRAVNRNLEHKKDTGLLLPIDEIKDIARDTLVKKWDEGVLLTDEDAEDGLGASKDAAIDRSVSMAEFHADIVAPNITPIAVQREFVIDVPCPKDIDPADWMPMQLTGTMDLEEPHAIADLKTSAKSPVRTLADQSMQLSMYSLAKKAIDGVFPDQVRLDYVVLTPAKRQLKHVPLVSRRGPEDMPALLSRIVTANRVIKSGVFTPADPTHWFCSKRYCSFWGNCKYAVRPVSVAV